MMSIIILPKQINAQIMSECIRAKESKVCAKRMQYAGKEVDIRNCWCKKFENFGGNIFLPSKNGITPLWSNFWT